MEKLLINNLNDNRYKIDFWIFHEDADEFKIGIMEGACRNISEIFNNVPIFMVFCKEDCPLYGKIFDEIYLLKPSEINLNTEIWGVNREFLINCLQNSIIVDEEEVKLTLIEAFQYLFNSDRGFEKIQNDHRCIFMGLFGLNEIHKTRGIDENEE